MWNIINSFKLKKTEDPVSNLTQEDWSSYFTTITTNITSYLQLTGTDPSHNVKPIPHKFYNFSRSNRYYGGG